MSQAEWDHYYELGRQAAQSGDYQGAEALWFAALQTVEFTGEDDPRLFNTLDNLAEACYCQGKTQQAKNLYWEGAAIKEKYLGPESLALASNLKRLAAIYYQQERYADAASLGTRLLKIYEKQHQEASNSSVETCMHEDHEKQHGEISEICLNLAILSQRLENIMEAKKYYDRAVLIRQNSRHPEPQVARVVQPFQQKMPSRPAKTCEICGRIYIGEICLKCTLNSLNAFETGKHAPIAREAASQATKKE